MLAYNIHAYFFQFELSEKYSEIYLFSWIHPRREVRDVISFQKTSSSAALTWTRVSRGPTSLVSIIYFALSVLIYQSILLYLAESLDALDEHEVHNDPGDEEGEDNFALETSHLMQASSDVQHVVTAEKY